MVAPLESDVGLQNLTVAREGLDVAHCTGAHPMSVSLAETRTRLSYFSPYEVVRGPELLTLLRLGHLFGGLSNRDEPVITDGRCALGKVFG